MANNFARCSKIVPNDAYWKRAEGRFVDENGHLLLERVATHRRSIEHTIMQDGDIQGSLSCRKDCADVIGGIEAFRLAVLRHHVAQIHAESARVVHCVANFGHGKVRKDAREEASRAEENDVGIFFF